MAHAPYKPINGYELGQILRQREAELPSSDRRTEDLTYRLAKALEETRIGLDLLDDRIARLEADLKLYRETRFKEGNLTRALHRQIAGLQAAKPKRRIRKAKGGQ